MRVLKEVTDGEVSVPAKKGLSNEDGLGRREQVSFTVGTDFGLERAEGSDAVQDRTFPGKDFGGLDTERDGWCDCGDSRWCGCALGLAR